MTTSKPPSGDTHPISTGENSARISFFTGLKNLFGFIAVILSFWSALITAFFVGPSIVIMMNAEGYHREVFTIRKLHYVHNDMRTQRTLDKYWADGEVAGQSEEYGLGGYVQGVPQNLEDLESQFQVGQKLDVMYNPNVSKKRGSRVLFAEDNFHETWRARQKRMVNTGYYPLGLALGLCFICGLLAGKTKSALKFAAGSSFFLIFAWVFVLLKLYG